METVDRDTQQLRKIEDSVATVHKVNEKTTHNQRYECYRCKGRNHNSQECCFKNAKCHHCGNTGHIRKACRVKDKSHVNVNTSHKQLNRYKNTAYMYAEEPELEMFSLSSNTEKHAFHVNFAVNQQDLLMEVDTGAAVGIISHARYKQLFAHVPLEGARVKLKTYTGEDIPVVGHCTVTPNLCGRNWLQKVKFNWKEIRYVSKTKQPGSIQEALEKYSDVFKN